MTIDAAEIARLREEWQAFPPVLALLDELEAATETFEDEQAAHADTLRLMQLRTTERDAAHALLRKALPMMDCSEHFRDLRARIAALLGDA